MIAIKCDKLFLRPLDSDFHELALIRIGSANDGGYVVPSKILYDCEAILSFGYGFNFDFEKSLLDSYGIREAYLFDGSINLRYALRQWVGNLINQLLGRPSAYITSWRNLKNFISMSKTNGLIYFNEYVGINGDNSNFLAILKNFLEFKSKHFILKCDIEGGEYGIIDDIILNYAYFDLMIIEFHGIASDEKKFEVSLLKILNFFHIVNININNNSVTLSKLEVDVDVLEITFINKSIIGIEEVPQYATSTHNKLNSKNNLQNTEYYYYFSDNIPTI